MRLRDSVLGFALIATLTAGVAVAIPAVAAQNRPDPDPDRTTAVAIARQFGLTLIWSAEACGNDFASGCYDTANPNVIYVRPDRSADSAMTVIESRVRQAVGACADGASLESLLETSSPYHFITGYLRQSNCNVPDGMP